MASFERLREYVDEHGSGMLFDFAFAVVWVTAVTIFFEVTNGPTWAYYMFMIAGVVVYYGLFGLEPNDDGDADSNV